MNLRTFLELGRVSNLPTVLTNVMCGALVARASIGSGASPLHPPGSVVSVELLVAFGIATCFYLGGMWLNDAFDARWDARHRPERPIPSGRISLPLVYGVGFGALSMGLAAAISTFGLSGAGARATLAATFTVLAILIYDRWHKGQPWAPLVMGACRAGVIAMAALAFDPTPGIVLWLAVASTWAYVVGLTHVARFETGTQIERLWIAGSVFAPSICAATLALLGGPAAWLGALVAIAHAAWAVRALRRASDGRPGSIPYAVGSLIAGIALGDAAFIAASGAQGWAALAFAGFLGTRLAQRKIAAS